MAAVRKSFNFPDHGSIVSYLNLEANPADQVYVAGNLASLKHFDTQEDAERWMDALKAVGGQVFDCMDATNASARSWQGPAGVPTPGVVHEITADPHWPDALIDTDVSGVQHEKRNPAQVRTADDHSPRR